jgi:F-type H+-transporting ATPase subunit delta
LDALSLGGGLAIEVLRVNTTSIARRYARALFELAVEEGRFEEVGAELARVASALESDPDLMVALRNPVTSREEKLHLAEAISAALKLSPLVANGLRLLAERSRLADLPLLERVYRELADAKAGRLRARVISAVPLSEESARSIARLLSGTGVRNVVVERSVDPSILGGVVAQVGSKVYDGSLRTQLGELGRQLKN